ncbi:hypothetical protein DAEQUDRAFT_264974 [Daedalea quercina L-15889]|uniref:Uncharacterized protein n=1 Tax=Daedalea quercina L-15889 TaxID=1314783 RepID=A0A165QFX5_9APHY|nr:hypothetical protein DAEQUDRAFT_264974 [Daedalea quercina L-15889]
MHPIDGLVRIGRRRRRQVFVTITSHQRPQVQPRYSQSQQGTYISLEQTKISEPISLMRMSPIAGIFGGGYYSIWLTASAEKMQTQSSNTYPLILTCATHTEREDSRVRALRGVAPGWESMRRVGFPSNRCRAKLPVTTADESRTETWPRGTFTSSQRR